MRTSLKRFLPQTKKRKTIVVTDMKMSDPHRKGWVDTLLEMNEQFINALFDPK